MKEWLMNFMIAYDDWQLDIDDDRNKEQFTSDYLRDHPLPGPSDEEIGQEAIKIINSYTRTGFTMGAKWYREQMKGE